MNKKIMGLLSATGGALAGAIGTGKLLSKGLKEKQSMSDKHLALFLMMNQWVKVKQEGKSIDAFLQRNGFAKIAIYGMSFAGETLWNELKNTEVEVSFGIDKKADSMHSGLHVYSVDDMPGDIDAVVVTSITFFEEIEEVLVEKCSCPILSLEDLLYDVLYEG